MGVGVVQVLLGDPQAWTKPVCDFPGGAAALREAAQAADVRIYVHAPYVINVATTNNRIRIPSRKLLGQVLALAGEVGAAGVIVHGGHVQADDDIVIGYDNWRKALEQVEAPVPLLIENTAGGAHSVTRTLASLQRLWDVIGGLGAGICLDTCHAHAAGIELESIVDQYLAITGRIDLVHANGSKDEFGSGRDRHANFGLGEGTIDAALIRSVVSQAKADAILETPGGDREHRADLDALR
jgi:deoxyribonuclease-4